MQNCQNGILKLTFQVASWFVVSFFELGRIGKALVWVTGRMAATPRKANLATPKMASLSPSITVDIATGQPVVWYFFEPDKCLDKKGLDPEWKDLNLFVPGTLVEHVDGSPEVRGLSEVLCRLV
jgi:hypothetical protein